MIHNELIDTEIRVLGCLIEKDMATPDYYPLSLSALTNACNQKSNRDPVVSYDEATVTRALGELKGYHLVYQSGAGRVPKYAHQLDKTYNLTPKELAVLCVLFLRARQTPGELKIRTERLYNFRDNEELNETLDHLAEMSFIRKLDKQPGQKESRYVHLFSGEPELRQEPAAQETARSAETILRKREERIEELETAVAELRTELAMLKEEFALFREQFE